MASGAPQEDDLKKTPRPSSPVDKVNTAVESGKALPGISDFPTREVDEGIQVGRRIGAEKEMFHRAVTEVIPSLQKMKMPKPSGLEDREIEEGEIYRVFMVLPTDRHAREFQLLLKIGKPITSLYPSLRKVQFVREPGEKGKRIFEQLPADLKNASALNVDLMVNTLNNPFSAVSPHKIHFGGPISPSQRQEIEAMTQQFSEPGFEADVEQSPPAYETGDFDMVATEKLSPGVRLGEYLIEEKIGQGGLGVVFSAKDTKTEERVVVKTLIMESPKRARMFQQEIQAMRKLEHPSMARIIREGITEKGAYVVMRYYQEGDLEHKKAEFRRMQAQDINDWFNRKFRPLVSALQVLHHRNVIHGDIKPSNIFIGPRGKLILGDFGFAASQEEWQQVTTVRGTPIYAAPEMMVAQSDISPVSDWFSMGAMLYQLFTGSLIYQGIAMTQGHWLHAHADYRAGKIHIKPIRDLNQNIPDSLAEFIMKLLAARPSDRIPDDQVLIELEKAIADAKSISGAA